MERIGIDGSRLILLLIGVCLGMTLVATVALWTNWSPWMRLLVLVSDALWMVGAARMVTTRTKGGEVLSPPLQEGGDVLSPPLQKGG